MEVFWERRLKIPEEAKRDGQIPHRLRQKNKKENVQESEASWPTLRVIVDGMVFTYAFRRTVPESMNILLLLAIGLQALKQKYVSHLKHKSGIKGFPCCMTELDLTSCSCRHSACFHRRLRKHVETCLTLREPSEVALILSSVSSEKSGKNLSRYARRAIQ